MKFQSTAVKQYNILLKIQSPLAKLDTYHLALLTLIKVTDYKNVSIKECDRMQFK